MHNGAWLAAENFKEPAAITVHDIVYSPLYNIAFMLLLCYVCMSGPSWTVLNSTRYDMLNYIQMGLGLELIILTITTC